MGRVTRAVTIDVGSNPTAFGRTLRSLVADIDPTAFVSDVAALDHLPMPVNVIAIASGVVVFILWIARRLRSIGWAIGLGLVLGGAMGNLTDRIFRGPGPLRGGVVDFLSVLDPWGNVIPVFNLADSAIFIGGCVIVVMAMLQRDYDGTRVEKPVVKKASE